MSDLDDRLLAAHSRGDIAGLVALYAEAADATDDVDRACFYLTHAYVFALESGDARARELALRLAAHGREPAPDGDVF